MAAALTQLATQANTTPNFANILSANGSFNIWQRGSGATSSFSVGASTTQYTADRWYITTGANQVCTVTATNSLDASLAPANAVKIQRNNGQTGVGVLTFGYPLTADECASICGGQVSFSGFARAGSTWSPAGASLSVNLYVGTGTAGKRGGGFTNETNPLSITMGIAGGAATTTLSGTSLGAVAATSTQGEIQVTWTPAGTAGADDSITLDAFCLVPGTIVQSLEGLPFDICLRQCKRFYRKSFPYGVAPAQNAGLTGTVSVVSQAASTLGFYVQLEPIEMIATASFTTFNPLASSAYWYNFTINTSVAAAVDTNGPSGKGFMIFVAASVPGNDESLYIHYVADAGY